MAKIYFIDVTNPVYGASITNHHSQAAEDHGQPLSGRNGHTPIGVLLPFVQHERTHNQANPKLKESGTMGP
jgi:hypothetical protein